MTVVVKRQVNHRLTRLVRRPGGMTVGAIEMAVEARLERLKDACLIDAQERVRRMARLAEALPAALGPDDLKPFFELANDIVGLAGVGHLAHAGHAALSLCRLLEGWAPDHPWSRTAFKVHLDALALLCRRDCDPDPAARDRIVQGLERVVERHRSRQAASLQPSRTHP